MGRESGRGSRRVNSALAGNTPDAHSKPRVVLGVTGGIAAYKSCTLLRLLSKAGVGVHVIPTPAALEMVGRTTWEALSGNPVYTRVTEGADSVTHIRYAQEADLIIVAPATANTLAKVRWGLADNLLTSTLLAATCPVIMAPAMHTEMWLDEATVENVAVLRDRGIEITDVATGALTSGDIGAGRMLEPEELADIVLERLKTTRDFEGVRIAISAGGTHEALDPVRFIGNRSSGRFGVEIARAALARGADVCLVAANVSADVLAGAHGAQIRRVESALDMQAAMREEAASADIIIMAAAVADYRPAQAGETKRKKTGEPLQIELVENPDILADLATNRGREGQMVVGFAAETGDENASALDYGIAKAKRKGADLLIVNEVGAALGFGDVDTAITIVNSQGDILSQAEGSKSRMAQHILSQLRETMK
ncbi:MAG: bifunctional phosphopantothenoylcysteine decarboxylase/phosphopantothenate--cysteine ligase CoaBC [Actinomycetaceae bacterium]|nr:bifunctional phosphopantothenoylcysteine decarboxylase/phosphopantothenate--cysteine ligase CoaBC [Actinomycetaceae bacterium]